MSGEYAGDVVADLALMVRSSLSRWELRPDTQVTLLNLSENATFALDAGGGAELVLRVHRVGWCSATGPIGVPGSPPSGSMRPGRGSLKRLSRSFALASGAFGSGSGRLAVSFIEHEPEVPALLEAWIRGYRTIAPLAGSDVEEISTFVVLRRILLCAWLASHSEVPLAGRLGAAYTEGTVALAQELLKGRFLFHS